MYSLRHSLDYAATLHGNLLGRLVEIETLLEPLRRSQCMPSNGDLAKNGKSNLESH